MALFRVHMFPIGHLPVATAEPARQLPPPPCASDYAAGLRFELHDHPESDLVDITPASSLATRDTPARGGGDPAVSALTAGYDPLAETHERDWDRRYLVRTHNGATEYVWPPCERYPEGGVAAGEPVVLEPGVELDRFGSEHGRVLSAVNTPYAQRSLPPEHLDVGYRRYRVRRPIPVWQAVTAPWFGQRGGGVRYRAVYPVRDLVAGGYLVAVTDADVPETTESGATTAEPDKAPADSNAGTGEGAR